MTQKNENLLSFLDGETMISFVPFPNNIRRSVVHEELKNVFEEIKKGHFRKNLECGSRLFGEKSG